MKIELKHLAPYLPYGLQFKSAGFDEDYNYNWNINPIIQNMDFIGCQLCFKFNYANKPLLKPLSNFPKDQLFKNLSDSDQTWIKNYLYSENTLMGVSLLEKLSYYGAELCFENHYDIFNLIPNNLALPL